MASLKEIKKRIGSVKSTQKITKAMKMVAAAKLRRAQMRAHNSRDYTKTLVAMVGRLVPRRSDDPHSLVFVPEKTTRTDYLILTSDRGLCGPFNSNLLRQFGAHLEESARKGIQVSSRVFGKKGRDFFKARDWKISDSLTGIYDHIDRKKAEEIGCAAMRKFEEKKTDAVYVVYNYFRSTMAQEIRFQKILPIEPQRENTAADVLYDPSAGRVLDRLLRECVISQIYSALLESVASELASRMTAMESATKNASEMIDALTLQYNRARQAAITTELMDIVNGAEALN